MKIRNDFVSNSSSVSYIITMQKEVVEIFENFFLSDEHKDNRENRTVITAVKNDLLKNGTRIYLEDKELYYIKYEFDDGEDTLLKEWADFDDINFETIDDETLWKLIRGEYFMRSELNSFKGFGVTQVDIY